MTIGGAERRNASVKRLPADPLGDGHQTTEWVVWSEEHSAWWAPGEHGYTNSLRRAGRYSEARAKAIAADANRYLKPDDLHEVALPDPMGRVIVCEACGSDGAAAWHAAHVCRRCGSPNFLEM